jgi:hypothetical protein
MGYAISWLAVRDADREKLTANLSLVATPETTYFGESSFAGRTIASGWFVLSMNQCSHPFVLPETLKRLTGLNEIVACCIEERAKYSTAELWRKGVEVWRLVHEAEIDMLHLAETGALPGRFSTMRNEYFARQAAKGGARSDTDYIFDIPLDMAKSIVGFKHDDIGAGDGAFIVFKTAAELAAAEAKHEKPRWKFW